MPGLVLVCQLISALILEGFTSDLLDAHWDALKEEGSITELHRRVEELSATGEVCPPKLPDSR